MSAVDSEFSGLRVDLDGHLRSLSGKFYVYALCRADGQPFYIGKGSNRRIIEHELQADRHHPLGESNPYKCNVIRKIKREGGSILYKIVQSFQADQQDACLAREAELINHFGRLHEGGPLTNLAGGLGSTSGSAPLSRERHSSTLAGDPANNPNRSKLNRFLLGIGPVESVPVKPRGQMTRILPTVPHPNARRPTLRCAYALIASAIANGITLRPGCDIPRSFEYQGVNALIENGVARDILKAGMATLIPALDPSMERFKLDASQVRLLADLYGREHMEARGVSVEQA